MPTPEESAIQKFLRTTPGFSLIYGAGERTGSAAYGVGQTISGATGIRPIIPVQSEAPQNPIEQTLGYSIYESMHGAGEWYGENVEKRYERAIGGNAGQPGFRHLGQAALGLVSSPRLAAEFIGMVPAGTIRLARETARDPSSLLAYVAVGLTLQGQSIKQGLQENPARFAGEMVGTALILEGVTRSMYRARPVDISKVEVPTGRMLKNPALESRFGRILARGKGLAGIETKKIVPEINRYRTFSVRNPISPIESRLYPVGGSAKLTVTGRELFKGSPTNLASERPISVYSPFELEKARPWTEGEWAVIGKTIKKMTPGVGDVLYTTQKSLKGAKSFSGLVNKQIETFRPPLKSFTPEAMDAGLKVISGPKYRNKVVVGGSISMQPKIKIGGYRDISMSDVDLYVKKSLMRNLYSDMVRDMAKKQPEIATNPETYYKEGTFQIKGNPKITDIAGKQLKGIHALPLEDFPVVAERTSQQWVKIQSGGKVKIPSTPYQLSSKAGGSFQRIQYKPGSDVTFTINRAKDIPDVYSLSSQSAANIYGRNPRIDVLRFRTNRATRTANNLAKTSEQFKIMGKSTATSLYEGIPIKQTTGPMFREITNPPLRGVNRTITPVVNIQAKHIAVGAAAGAFFIGGPAIPIAMKGAIGIAGMVKLRAPKAAPYIQKSLKVPTLRTPPAYGGQKIKTGYKPFKPTQYYQKTPKYSQYKTVPHSHYSRPEKYVSYKTPHYSTYKPIKTGYSNYKPIKTPNQPYIPYKQNKTPPYTPNPPDIPKPKPPEMPRGEIIFPPQRTIKTGISWPEEKKQPLKRIASVKDLGWKITNPVPHLKGFLGKKRKKK